MPVCRTHIRPYQHIRSPTIVVVASVSCFVYEHAILVFDFTFLFEQANIFKIVEEEGNWKDVRKIVISIILHTDMMHHFQMVSQLDVFTEVHDKSWTAGALIDFLKPDERVFILNLIMHSADISNPVKPFHVYEKWARAVLDEFFRQVRYWNCHFLAFCKGLLLQMLVFAWEEECSIGR